MTSSPDAEPLAPLVEALPPELDAPTAFRRLAHLPDLIWFDSARRHATLGRYSYISALSLGRCTCAPPDRTQPFENEANPGGLAALREALSSSPVLGPLDDYLSFVRRANAATVPGLPPFQGGAAGLLGYDLGWWLEPNVVPVHDKFHVPAYAVGVYPTVLAFDHATNQGWIIAHGWSNEPREEWPRIAQHRLSVFRQALGLEAETLEWSGERSTPPPAIPAHELGPLNPIPGSPELSSNFTRDEYLKAVQRAIDYIHAGDAFQVNLAQRLLAPAKQDPRSLYLQLRERNPAPFAGYFDAGDYQIASASPERFIQVLDRRVETRPIKGTRQRALMPEADLFSGDELLTNEKDRAENVMIVDLLRNDLSRVCTPDSVRVTRLCGLEQYQYVQHLTSVIEGRLRDDKEPLDLIRAAFPGGSITGAPKPRAMEIIAELEGVARGAYCGSLFYLGHDGAFDSSILIRTITSGGGWVQAHVGGGITADSSPAAEYDETMHKAQGLAQVMLAEKRST